MSKWTDTNLIPLSGLEYWHLLDDTVSGAEVLDYSGNDRHLTADDSNAPVLRLNQINNKPAIYFDGTNSPLQSSADMVTLKHIFIIASFEYAEFEGNEGLLSDTDATPILYGAGAAATKFYDLANGSIYRKNNLRYIASNQAAPMSSNFALIELIFAEGVEMEGFQIGQKLNDVSTKWEGFFAESFAFSRILTAIERQKIFLYCAIKFALQKKGIPFYFPSDDLLEDKPKSRFYAAPLDYAKITEDYQFEDGNKTFNEKSDAPPRRWEYNYLGNTPQEAVVFDEFYNQARTANPFLFRDKYGVLWQNVRVEDYDRTHDAHKSWIVDCKFKLVKYSDNETSAPEVVSIGLPESPILGYYTGEVTFPVEAIDDSMVDHIDIYLNGILFDTIEGGYGVITWDTSETSESGETEIVEVKAIAVDDLGNESSDFVIFVPVQNTAPPVTVRLNCGDTVTSGLWTTDTGFFDSGSSYSSGALWRRYLIPGGASSNDVYTKFRFKSGTMKYTIPGLNPSADALIRIHYGDQSFGFVQSINANGVEKVASYTLQTDAGASTRIGIKEFTAAADGSGEIELDFIGGSTSAVSAIEVLQPVPAKYNMIHLCGDSTTAGGGVISETEAWFNQLGILLDGNVARLNNNDSDDFISYDETKKWTVHNVARSGDPIETQESLMTTYADPYLYADLLDKSIMFLSCGINNVLANESAATIQGKLTSFFAAVDSGFTTGIGTLTPSTSLTGPQETVRQTVNTWIRANSLGIDFIVDWEDDARLADASDTTYFYDGLHNTEAGHIVRAEIMQEVLENL